jgi:hypothetical protein
MCHCLSRWLATRALFKLTGSRALRPRLPKIEARTRSPIVFYGLYKLCPQFAAITLIFKSMARSRMLFANLHHDPGYSDSLGIINLQAKKVGLVNSLRRSIPRPSFSRRTEIQNIFSKAPSFGFFKRQGLDFPQPRELGHVHDCSLESDVRSSPRESPPLRSSHSRLQFLPSNMISNSVMLMAS